MSKFRAIIYPVNIQKILSKTVLNLTAAGIVNTAKLDSELLLAYLLKKDRAWVLAHPEYVLEEPTLQQYNNLISRRELGESIAYITEHKEFYGRDFFVNKDVLVPRPESESFLELLKPLAKIIPPKGIFNVLDMGTGSGCLAITVKLENPHLHVYATDTSKNALTVAIKNTLTYDVPIVFKEQDLLAGDKVGYDVIIANLPYVPDKMQDKSIMHEPKEALFSGNDGMNHYKRLFKQLEPKLIRYVMTESLLSQHNEVTELAKKAGYTPTSTDGLVQFFTKKL